MERSSKRAGVILISVFICLLAVVLVATSLMRAAAIERRQLRSELQQTQTEWLLRSGLYRAVRKVERDEKYVGEMWVVDDRSLRQVAQVRILVTRLDLQHRQIVVEAQYPKHALRRTLKRKKWNIELRAGGKR